MSSGRLPEEIRAFLDQPGGHSLLVRGRAGTGKTTFCLQLLEEFTSPDDSLYLTTRVSDKALYQQFPWLEEKEMRDRVIDSSRVLLHALVDQSSAKQESRVESDKVRSARDFLRSISSDPQESPDKVDRSRLNQLTKLTPLPEIERIYDRIDTILPSRATVVLDSLEGLTQKYGLNQADFLITLQKDLVESSRTNLIVVLETEDALELEYLVDGVIEITRGEMDGRRIRGFALIKLRATRIGHPKYLCSLEGGRFQAFRPHPAEAPPAGEWIPVPHPEGAYSTGIPDLDAILDGGYKAGSYNVLEIGENIAREEYYSLLRPIFLNFLSQGNGINAILSGGEHPDTFRDDLVRYFPADKFDGMVRVGDHFTRSATRPYIMALGGHEDDAVRNYHEGMEAIRGPDNRPIIDLAGFDTIEYLQGGKVAITQLLDAIAKVKVSKDLGLGILKPGLQVTKEIINMADTYFRIVDIAHVPCIYGIKPKSIIHAIVPDESGGSASVRLVPIV